MLGKCRVAAAICLGLLYCVAPQQARGETPDYDALIAQASAAYGEKRYEQARDLFEQAHVLQPSARTLRGLGLTAFALDRHAQARQELESALADPRKPLPREQRREVNDVLAWMKQRLGALRLELSPEHALALVDDKAAIAGLNLFELGEHVLSVRATGYVNQEQRFVLEREVPLELRIQLQPQPPAAVAVAEPAPPPAPPVQLQPALAVRDEAPAKSESGSVFSRWWFWTIAGVVVATTVVAVVVASHEPSPQPLPSGMVLHTQ
ncbi:MAG TPA: tetratricopeptide repeat protein [Polyangiales bacterium]|nr:tetratricopeptide repeat protein [Polyangiales bacterium]